MRALWEVLSHAGPRAHPQPPPRAPVSGLTPPALLQSAGWILNGIRAENIARKGPAFHIKDWPLNKEARRAGAPTGTPAVCLVQDVVGSVPVCCLWDSGRG